MNQSSFQAITAMVNSFPQASAAERKALLLTYEKALGGVPDQAISRTAAAFIRNEIPHQSATFAPSVAEFVQAARRVPIERISLPKPEREYSIDDAAKARLRLKMPMYRYATECNLMPELDAANRSGFSAMIALADRWGVEIPEELLTMPGDVAERQWDEARRMAWVEVERNLPPFLKRQRKQEAA
jgi:hypothetical protein